MADLIQEEVVALSVLEANTQQLDVFNEASRGGLVLTTLISTGWATITKYFEGAKGGVRRDTTETFTPNELGRISVISPKMNRQSAYTKTLSAIKKMEGVSNAQYSELVGQAHASDEASDYANIMIGIAANVISSNENLTLDVSAVGDGTLTYPVMIAAAAKFGNKAPLLQTVIIHSKPFYDMSKDIASGNSIYVPELGLTIVDGIPAYPNKVFVVTDAPDLVFDNAGTDNYITLMLVPGGGVATKSEEPFFNVDNTSKVGNETSPESVYDYTPQFTLRGWSFTAGIDNPTEAQIKTAGNWTLKSELSNSAGVAIITK